MIRFGTAFVSFIIWGT